MDAEEKGGKGKGRGQFPLAVRKKKRKWVGFTLLIFKLIHGGGGKKKRGGGWGKVEILPKKGGEEGL